jgi:NADH:ubiquinone oxidoreductase subunit H
MFATFFWMVRNHFERTCITLLPSNADGPLFVWAPVLALLTSQATWAALPTISAGAK